MEGFCPEYSLKRACSLWALCFLPRHTPLCPHGRWAASHARTQCVVLSLTTLQGLGDLPCFVQELRVADLLGKGAFCQRDHVEINTSGIGRQRIPGRPSSDVQLSIFSFITLGNLDVLTGFLEVCPPRAAPECWLDFRGSGAAQTCCWSTRGHLSVKALGLRCGQTQHSLKYVCSSTAQGKPVHLLVSSSIKWGYPILYTPATVHIGKQTLP